MKAKVNKVTIQIVRDDILALSVNGIVTSTDPNLSLSPDLSVKAGIDVQRECREIGWCDVGSAVITDAGNLLVEKLIHAVGPRWGEGSERAKLANVTLHCLRLAEENQLKSIALPPISTGALGYPLEHCAKIMLTQIIDFTFEDLKYLRTVILCVVDIVAFEAFQREFERQLGDLKESGEGKVKI